MMKKVLVYKSTLLPYSETFIRDQVLAYANWQPTLVGIHRVSGVDLDGIDTLVLRKSSPTVFQVALAKLFREIERPLPGVVRRLKQKSADLIHVHFGNEAVAFAPTARELGLPVVVTLHGADISINKEWWEKRNAISRKYPGRLVALAHNPKVHFVAVSKTIQARAIEFGIPADRISVHYIGVDLSRFRLSGCPITARRRRILFVGRFVEKKGCEFLIKAYARVKSKIQDAELVLIGDGPLKDQLIKISKELNVPVVFLGSLSSNEVKKQLDETRVFCLPSIIALNGDAEGLPLVILEAQASGVPVVTSARGGATEGIIDGVTGFAFPERDIVSLSAHLTRLLVDDDLAASMSGAGPKLMTEKFNVRHCTRNLEGFYENVIRN